jgi:hypothetical protein
MIYNMLPPFDQIRKSQKEARETVKKRRPPDLGASSLLNIKTDLWKER